MMVLLAAWLTHFHAAWAACREEALPNLMVMSSVEQLTDWTTPQISIAVGPKTEPSARRKIDARM
jgi:hypothetical protein